MELAVFPTDCLRLYLSSQSSVTLLCSSAFTSTNGGESLPDILSTCTIWLHLIGTSLRFRYKYQQLRLPPQGLPLDSDQTFHHWIHTMLFHVASYLSISEFHRHLTRIRTHQFSEYYWLALVMRCLTVPKFVRNCLSLTGYFSLLNPETRIDYRGEIQRLFLCRSLY